MLCNSSSTAAATPGTSIPTTRCRSRRKPRINSSFVPSLASTSSPAIKGAVAAASAPAAAQQQQQQQQPLPEGERLKEWVRSQGGEVHPDLVLVEHAPCGCRGVVAAADINEGPGTPLIAVPERLFLTSSGAADVLGLLLDTTALSALQGLDPVLQLALLLAHERSKGEDSLWWPYVQALHPLPPSAWAMGDKQLQKALKELGPMASGWAQSVSSARRAVDAQASAVASAFGRFVPGADEDSVRWGMGHVLSRCFGSPPELALLPFVDLCNARAEAAPPDGLYDDEGESYGVVIPTWQGQHRALQPGDELYISYDIVAGTTSPLTTFLSFGFVPDELRKQR